MALSNAERQRRYRERQKDRARDPLRVIRECIVEDVAEWWHEHGESSCPVEGETDPSPEKDVDYIFEDLRKRMKAELRTIGSSLEGERKARFDRAVEEALAVLRGVT